MMTHVGRKNTPSSSKVASTASGTQRGRSRAVNRDELAILFKIFDTEELGTIDVREFKAALRALGLHITNDDIHQMLMSLNRTSTAASGYNGSVKDGITFEEFCVLAESRMPDRLSKESLYQTFELFGGGPPVGNGGVVGPPIGHIDVNNLRLVCDELGEDITDNELEQMISYADRDGDGFVSYQDFEKVMRKKYDPFTSSDSE